MQNSVAIPTNNVGKGATYTSHHARLIKLRERKQESNKWRSNTPSDAAAGGAHIPPKNWYAKKDQKYTGTQQSGDNNRDIIIG